MVRMCFHQAGKCMWPRGSHFSGYTKVGKIELASAPKSNKHPRLIRIDLIPLAGTNPASFTNDVEKVIDASDIFPFGFKHRGTESEAPGSYCPGPSFGIWPGSHVNIFLGNKISECTRLWMGPDLGKDTVVSPCFPLI